jgi:hypothetical protein
MRKLNKSNEKKRYSQQSRKFELTLCVTQCADIQSNSFLVEIVLDCLDLIQKAVVSFKFTLTTQEQENIQWYFEDYLHFIFDPAPQIATKVEKHISEIGTELFNSIFLANENAYTLWTTAYHNLNDTHIIIRTDDLQAAAIPWELLHDPRTNTWLALESLSFVRKFSQQFPHSKIPLKPTRNIIRILLIICRPKGKEDIPYRSIASQLIKNIGETTDYFKIDVLRPPTFDQLYNVLDGAKAEGMPYQIVHFDGHGVFFDAIAETSGTKPDVRNMRGYLMFENLNNHDKTELIHGELLGKILVKNDVALLIINACRSDYSETLEKPATVNEGNTEQLNKQMRIRAFGSLAQEVIGTGLTSVVAMRYNVYTLTVVQFIAAFYKALVQGQTIGVAVSFARKHLNIQQQKTDIYPALPIQDWLVPTVYEAIPTSFFLVRQNINKQAITQNDDRFLSNDRMFDTQFSKKNNRFIGRDETLLAIDRSFDQHSIVLLYGFTGSGKTSTALEFGRWYLLTGGINGYILFTSFQRPLPLPRVLDKLSQVFADYLNDSGINWLKLNDNEQRIVALDLLSRIPVLWIWDNIESIAGFPNWSTQGLNEIEQQELIDFLREVQKTKAKFLLTSRRDEKDLLENIPIRIQLLPMPMLERVELLRKMAKEQKYNQIDINDINDWRSLLEYTQGNPMTIVVLVKQVFESTRHSKLQIEAFVKELRLGEFEISGDEQESSSRSLLASLDYGFTKSFNETERQQLAVLYSFHKIIDVDLFLSLGNDKQDYYLPIIKCLSNEDAISLLKRATAVGLLEKKELTPLDYFGNTENLYEIHPALPWLFKRFFGKYYSSNQESTNEKVENVFIEVMKDYSKNFEYLYHAGIQSMTGFFDKQEDNLLHAVYLSRIYKHWESLDTLLRNLHDFYTSVGRKSDWLRLLQEALPDKKEIIVNGDSSKNKENLVAFLGYQYDLALDKQNYIDAERIRKEINKYMYENTVSLLKLPVKKLDYAQRNRIRLLGVGVEKYGYLLAQQNKLNCINYYKEAYEIYKYISDKEAQSVLANLIGNFYLKESVERNFETASYWFKKSLRLCNKVNFIERCRILISLGNLALYQFLEARNQELCQDCQDKLQNYTRNALNRYQEALKLLNLMNQLGHHPLPFDLLGAVHNGIGCVYGNTDRLEKALFHYKKAIEYAEEIEDDFFAATARYNIAIDLRKHPEEKGFEDALLYAQSALHSFQTCGDIANTQVKMVQQLIVKIEQKL